MFNKMTATDGQGASAVVFERVSKRVACAVWMTGAPVVLCPAKFAPFGGFRPSMMAQRDIADEKQRAGYGLSVTTFDSLVRDFCSYNANCWETGYYASYWVARDVLTKHASANGAPLWFIEVTDVYGGEANYSWVTRHVIRAKTQRGALNRFSALSGMHWHGVGCERYDSESGATCYFLSHYDADAHAELRLDTDERA